MHQPQMSKFIDILIYAILVSSALILAIILFRLVHGNFLNSYPYISPDGFDWLYEGAYLKAVLTGWPISELPLPLRLRQPVFVLVTTLDAAAGSRGIIIITSIVASFVLSALAINKILIELGISSPIRAWGIIAFTMSPLNFYVYWVLSDQLAISLMMISTFYLIKSDLGVKRRWLMAASIAAVLAGWTQFYGLIPFCLGTILFFIYRGLKHGQWIFALIIASVFVVGIWAAGLYLWFGTIPHEDHSTQFALLKLSFNMLDFYINTWTFGFGPLLIVCICALITASNGLKIFANVYTLYMVLVVFAFSILVFMYQWPEARFSFLYQGFVIIVTCILLQGSSRTASMGALVTDGVAVAAILTIVFGGMFLLPDNYWQPRLGGMRVDFRGSWIGTPITGTPLDRFHLQAACSSPVQFCAAADATAFATFFGFYVLRVTSDYRKLMLLVNGTSTR